MMYDFKESFKSFYVVNLTPHTINFILPYNYEVGRDEMGIPEYSTYDKTFSVSPSGMVARCKTERQIIDSIQTEEIDDGWEITIPITSTKFGEVEGLPQPQERTIYIVSSLVAQACKDREDIFIPDDVVRDDEGKIIGCRSLGRI